MGTLVCRGARSCIRSRFAPTLRAGESVARLRCILRAYSISGMPYAKERRIVFAGIVPRAGIPVTCVRDLSLKARPPARFARLASQRFRAFIPLLFISLVTIARTLRAPTEEGTRRCDSEIREKCIALCARIFLSEPRIKAAATLFDKRAFDDIWLQLYAGDLFSIKCESSNESYLPSFALSSFSLSLLSA